MDKFTIFSLRKDPFYNCVYITFDILLGVRLPPTNH